MFVGFIDMNKAYLKDFDPLPNIDSLLYTALDYTIWSFCDTFHGYNQILMWEEDHLKMAFIINKGVFCYKVMLFNLKNMGTTYQRMMNKVFKDQIGRNLEVHLWHVNQI